MSDSEDDAPTPTKSDSAPPRPRFKSDAGRVVLGGGGIVPDVEVANRVLSDADKRLQTVLGANAPKFRDAMVELALSKKVARAIPDPSFAVTPAMRDELYQRIRARGLVLDRAVYDSAAPLVSRALATQLSRYVFGTQAEFTRGLREDVTVNRALELLTGVTTQQALLGKVKQKSS